MAGKTCLIRGHFFGNSTCWGSFPFPSAPKSGLIPPPPHSLSGSLPGWSQTPVSPSLSPQELGQLPSLSWCWNNIGLRVLMSQTLGKSCLKPGRLLFSKGPEGRGYASPNRLEFPKGLYLSVSGGPPPGMGLHLLPQLTVGEEGWSMADRESKMGRWLGVLPFFLLFSSIALSPVLFLLVSSLGLRKEGQ